MAPLKFEDSIKDKLEQRTIQPSNRSWEKLEKQLDGQYGQKKIKKYWWLGIAASIVGFLIITTIFMSTNRSVKSSNIEIVDTSTEVVNENESTDLVEAIQPESKSNIKKDPNEKETLVKPIVIAESNRKENNSLEKNRSTVNSTSDNNKIITPENVFKEKTNDIVISQIDTVKKKTIEIDNKSLLINTEVIDNKIAGVVASVNELQKNNGTVSGEEVDALLRRAQLEITTQQILKSNTVNASALLLDVESELDESFKNRVFEALKTGFQKLKTTVVERDN